jgi:hypothetical protein
MHGSEVSEGVEELDSVVVELRVSGLASGLLRSGLLEPDEEARSSTLARRCLICSCRSLMVMAASLALFEGTFESLLARGARGV